MISMRIWCAEPQIKARIEFLGICSGIIKFSNFHWNKRNAKNHGDFKPIQISPNTFDSVHIDFETDNKWGFDLNFHEILEESRRF